PTEKAERTIAQGCRAANSLGVAEKRLGRRRGASFLMPEYPQQDVTSFKARTHHGSGQKETYELKACVYLEDARPVNDRAVEVPREMRLSLLRWDCPEEECEAAAEEEEDGEGDEEKEVAVPPAALSSRNAPGGAAFSAAAARPMSSSSSSSSSSLGRRERVGRGLAGGAGGGSGGGGRGQGEGGAGVGRAEDDRFPGDPEPIMREEAWMLCNLDEHLLLSQFHPLPPPPPPPPISRAQQRQLSGPSSIAEHGEAAGPFVSSNPYLNQPKNSAPRVAAALHHDALPLSERRTSAVVNGAAGAAPAAAAGMAPEDGRARGSGGGSGGGGLVGGDVQNLPPVARQLVTPTRREERVTFHARPTCHDFLRG
ncbi:unnamed protein product, partial [Scytosiphon promiscuus]